MLLELKDARVVYASKIKEVTALDNISFKVNKGDFLSIVGPSGCGKTTVLRAIAGLINITSGKIVKPDDFNVAYVFQEPTLLEWRTVIDNVALPLEIRKMKKEKRYKKARKVLKLVDLDGFENVYPKNLSGGMRQRVAIARALVSDPEILLMDEPFGALDEPTRFRLNVELERIWRKTGITILFVTHNVGEAVFLSNKVAVLSGRPARLKKIIDVDLPVERDLKLLDSEKFVRLVLKVRKIFDR